MEMLNLKDISEYLPDKGKVLVYWMGGGSFLLKFDNGTTICIDPYLSDSVERLFGFKRLVQAPITAHELKFDLLLITHEHGDHLDIDIFETLVKNNSEAKTISPKSCESFISEYTTNYIITEPGKKHSYHDVTIETVMADHGDLSPDAVGFMIYFGNRKLYFTGDTALNYGIMNYAIKQQPDIIIPCINGAYGNMDEKESADLALRCNSKHAIGSHYGMFKEHGGNVELFKTNLAEINPVIKCFKLSLGQGEEV